MPLPRRSPPPPINLAEVRERARRRLPAPIFDLIDGAADDELADWRNRQAWARKAVVARVGIDVSRRTQTRSLFGVQLASPIVLAPTGLLGIYHRDGDRAAARAAVARGSALVVSTVSMVRVAEVAAVAADRVWFQLYLLRDRAATEQIVRDVLAAGVRVLVVTMDVPVGGRRERDIRHGLTIPLRVTPATVAAVARRPRWALDLLRERNSRPGLRTVALPNMPGVDPAGLDAASVVEAISSQFNPTLTWTDVAWLRERWPHTLVVKGIMCAADARCALDAGADGVVASNHGGRQLGAAAATAEVLPEVVGEVDRRVPVLVDGGIRRGTDVLVALALGADAVQIGRPYLYGLGYGGQAGVERVLAILCDELDRALALSGHPGIDDLDRSSLA